MNKYLYFEDLHKFWNYAFQESNAHRKSSRDGRRGASWDNNLTWDEAKALALRGWQEGLQEIEEQRTNIFPKVANHVLRPIPINANCGPVVDVGAYLSNNPECFISREWEKRNYPGKLYTLVVSCTFSCSITAETIVQRGAMICAMVDAMEYAGHRVEVICNETSTHYNNPDDTNKFEIDVVIKKHDQPLEMSDLAFCLAHPAMLRRIMFSVEELNGWSDFTSNYGYPAPATNKGDLYIDEIHSGKVPNDVAVEWVISKMKELGVEFEDS